MDKVLSFVGVPCPVCKFWGDPTTCRSDEQLERYMRGTRHCPIKTCHGRKDVSQYMYMNVETILSTHTLLYFQLQRHHRGIMQNYLSSL